MNKAFTDFISYIVRRNKLWEQKYINNTFQYTDDPILERYKFTNIWRELDHFSKEEIKRMQDKDLYEQILLIGIARHSINWQTTELLLNGIEYDDLYDYWQQCKKESKQFVSDAILFQAPKGSNRAKLLIKHRNRVFAKAKDLRDDLVSLATYNKNGHIAFDMIKNAFGCGPFRSYEMFTSLTYSKHLHFHESDFLHVGPGSINGFKTVYGNYMNEQYIEKVIDTLVNEVKEALLNIDDFYWIPEDMQGSVHKKEKYKFTYRTLEDCMCEYRKYVNLCNGKGRGRIYKDRQTKQIGLFE